MLRLIECIESLKNDVKRKMRGKVAHDRSHVRSFTKKYHAGDQKTLRLLFTLAMLEAASQFHGGGITIPWCEERIYN
jgi:hypothetical protein